MSDLRELYQEVIIDHNKNPRNFRVLEPCTHHAEGFNPLCGDQLALYLEIENNIIKKTGFQGKGCAISTASASLMTEALIGKTPAEAGKLFHLFHQLMVSSDEKLRPDVSLGKLAVFAGVREFPARVKCATLPWHALEAALHQNNKSVSTE